MNTLKEICRNSGDYLIALIPYLAHVIAESEITEEIRTLRWDGLCKLHGQLRRYEKRNYDSTLLSSLAAKKAEQIVQARTKKEMEQIFNPHAPYFDGVKRLCGLRSTNMACADTLRCLARFSRKKAGNWIYRRPL